MAFPAEEWRRDQIRRPASEALGRHGSVVTCVGNRWREMVAGTVREEWRRLRTRAVGRGKSGGSFGPALSVPLWRGGVAVLPPPGEGWHGTWRQVEMGLRLVGPDA
jgi:hypothetical protein